MKYEIAANICRVCLIKKKKLRSLYKPTDVDEVPPNVMIEKVTGIHVEEMRDLPMLPKSICKNCELSLSMAYEFRVKTLKSKRIIDHYLRNLLVNDMKQEKLQQQEELNTLQFKQIKKNAINNVGDQGNAVIKIKEANLDEFIELQQFDVDDLDDENIDPEPDADFDPDNGAAINANANGDIHLAHSNNPSPNGDYNGIKEEDETNDGDDNEQLQHICKTETENVVKNNNENVEGISGACFPEADTLEELEEQAVQEEEELEEEEGHYYDIHNDDDNNDMAKMTEDGTQEDDVDEIFEEHLEMEKLSQTTESTESQQYQTSLENTIGISEEECDNKSEAANTTTVQSRKRTKTKSKKNVTVKSELRHICDICGNVYMKRGRMMEHRQRHDKELKYSCELCDKKFHMRELLRKHMYSHNGGKPLKCDYCSRTFYYESVRKAHENVHKGLRPYVCDVCGKSFCYGHTLKKHKLIHAEIKLYRCDYCNKSFRLQHHMKQHELTKLHKNAVLMSKERYNTTIIEDFLPNEKNSNQHIDGIYTEAIYIYK